MEKKQFRTILEKERHTSMIKLVLVVLVAVGGLAVGCGKGEAEKAAARAAVPKQILKWKHIPKSAVGAPKGIVVEMEGDKVTAATLYELKAGDGFAIYSTIGKGDYLPAKGQLVFSITGNLMLNANEASQVNDAVRWEVPFQSTATNLAGTFWLDGRDMGVSDFARFQE